MQTYAIKALEADNEADAKKFLEKKTALTADAIELQASYELASVNAEQMKQMHTKLVADITELESRRSILKGKASEIGRGSCRERGEMTEGRGAVLTRE